MDLVDQLESEDRVDRLENQVSLDLKEAPAAVDHLDLEVLLESLVSFSGNETTKGGLKYQYRLM